MNADYNPEIHHRRSIRLRGYDYSQAGAYFLTICTFQRTCLFGENSDGTVKLSDIGKIAEEEWIKTAEVRKYVELDAFVVMPNHVHGILVIGDAP
jgi:putative transposase